MLVAAGTPPLTPNPLFDSKALTLVDALVATGIVGSWITPGGRVGPGRFAT